MSPGLQPLPNHPSLYQINTRPWLYSLGQELGLSRPATLDDVPDSALEALAASGFDWVWLLGVWQTGSAGQRISAEQPAWHQDYANTLPDFSEADVCGSPFAIVSYTAHTDFGGPDALARMRARLAHLGLHLLLDFVPNHTALDHPWVQEHPEFYVHGNDWDLAQQPQNFVSVQTGQGRAVLAHGKDPYFDGWPDTLQLNYRHAGLREAMVGELLSVAVQCDAVRCDMAMLILPDVFLHTWGDRALPIDGSQPVDQLWWPDAIGTVQAARPSFAFMAEVYWDLEWTLQQQGFDYTYDKRLYDRLVALDTPGTNGHLHADADFQRRSARFTENHDEPRAAATFPPREHQAAAIVTYLAPGLRFFHLGQLEGSRVKTSLHLRRWPTEPVDATLRAFYGCLLEIVRRPEVRNGTWVLLAPRAAWDGNGSWDRFVAFTWMGQNEARLVIAVNYGANEAQCYLDLPWADLHGRIWRLRDIAGSEVYERSGDELASRGLYLSLPAWGYNVFEMRQL